MWRKYFKLVGLVPGRIIVQRFGTIDFSGDVPVETCKKLYEQDFRYLEITEEGKEELYGMKKEARSRKKEEGRRKPEAESRKSSGKRKKTTSRTYKRRSSDTDS